MTMNAGMKQRCQETMLTLVKPALNANTNTKRMHKKTIKSCKICRMLIYIPGLA